jgi:hypothetical protein
VVLTSFEAFERYRAERRASEQAYQRVKYVLSFAVINRMVSAIAAAKQASSARARERALEGGGVRWTRRSSRARAWRGNSAPGRGFVPDARVACVLRLSGRPAEAPMRRMNPRSTSAGRS